ncbi:MAG: DUF4199 domain-containing protein [Bacteroidales bacterium]|nr:DUF4199 domain-containing protein [Bacteroidales bacterium]
MNTNSKLWKIAFKWGALAAGAAMVINIIDKYCIHGGPEWTERLFVPVTLVEIVVCIYFGIKEYRSKKQTEEFLFSDGISVSSLMILCYGIIFSLYFIVLSQCVDKQLVDRYKHQQITKIEQSSHLQSDKDAAIASLKNATLASLLLGNFLQMMIFPFTIALFLSVGMQRKHKLINKETEKQAIDIDNADKI